MSKPKDESLDLGLGMRCLGSAVMSLVLIGSMLPTAALAEVVRRDDATVAQSIVTEAQAAPSIDAEESGATTTSPSAGESSAETSVAGEASAEDEMPAEWAGNSEVPATSSSTDELSGETSSDVAVTPSSLPGSSGAEMASPVAVAQVPAEPASLPKKGTFEVEGVTWEYRNFKDKLTLTACHVDGARDELIVPTEYSNLPVYAIRSSALSDLKGVRKLVVPSDMRLLGGVNRAEIEELVVGDNAHLLTGSKGFSTCPNLKKVTIGENVEARFGVFEGCQSITDADVASSAEGMFMGCTSLKNVYMANASNIPAYMFYGCSSLGSFDLSHTTEIGGYAFRESGIAGELVIPDSVTSIGERAFLETKITSLSIPATVEKMGQGAFHGTPLESIMIDTSATADGIFSQAPNIKYITVGPHVSSFHKSTFQGTPEGALVTIDPDNEHFKTTDHHDVMSRDTGEQLYPYIKPAPTPPTEIRHIDYGTTEVNVGSSIEKISDTAFLRDYLHRKDENNGFLCIKTITVDPANTHFCVDEQGILYTADMSELIKAPCTLEKVTIPASVRVIKRAAFCYCPKLKEVDIPEGVQDVSHEAFSECTSLVRVGLPSTLRSLGAMAFQNCPLTSIDLPEGLLDIGMGAFEGTHLSSLRLPSSLVSKDSKMKSPEDFSADPDTGEDWALFYGDNSSPSIGYNWASFLPGVNPYVKSIDLSAYKASFIPNYAFRGLVGLNEILLPFNVTQVGYGSFNHCLGLKDVYVYSPTNFSTRSGGDIQGNSGSGIPGESYQLNVPSSFSYYKRENGVGQRYHDMQGLNFYGAAYKDNALIKFCTDSKNNFIPIVILQSGKTVFGDYDVTYGTERFDYNHLEVVDSSKATEAEASSVPVGGTPAVRAVFGDYDTMRVLETGKGCTVAYFDEQGNPVTSFEKAGVYTASVIGDGKSVIGTRQMKFQVGEVPPTPEKPDPDKPNPNPDKPGTDPGKVVPGGSKGTTDPNVTKPAAKAPAAVLAPPPAPSGLRQVGSGSSPTPAPRSTASVPKKSAPSQGQPSTTPDRTSSVLHRDATGTPASAAPEAEKAAATPSGVSAAKDASPATHVAAAGVGALATLLGFFATRRRTGSNEL